jgi:hypothetical protein
VLVFVVLFEPGAAEADVTVEEPQNRAMINLRCVVLRTLWLTLLFMKYNQS